MSVETLISVEEYLNTSYDPDMEYVDGVLVERNVGDWFHSTVQYNILLALGNKYPKVYVRPELRSKTRETRFRLPDVCVVLKRPKTKYLVDAAYLAIEILSEDDRMTRVMERLEEFDKKGVSNIWVIDPRLRTISIYSHGTLDEVQEDRVATEGEPRLELTRDEIFRDLDAEE
jgi:Uma2 family endonuclease